MRSDRGIKKREEEDDEEEEEDEAQAHRRTESFFSWDEDLFGAVFFYTERHPGPWVQVAHRGAGSKFFFCFLFFFFQWTDTWRRLAQQAWDYFCNVDCYRLARK